MKRKAAILLCSLLGCGPALAAKFEVWATQTSPTHSYRYSVDCPDSSFKRASATGVCGGAAQYGLTNAACTLTAAIIAGKPGGASEHINFTATVQVGISAGYKFTTNTLTEDFGFAVDWPADAKAKLATAGVVIGPMFSMPGGAVPGAMPFVATMMGPHNVPHAMVSRKGACEGPPWLGKGRCGLAVQASGTFAGGLQAEGPGSTKLENGKGVTAAQPWGIEAIKSLYASGQLALPLPVCDPLTGPVTGGPLDDVLTVPAPKPEHKSFDDKLPKRKAAAEKSKQDGRQ